MKTTKFLYIALVFISVLSCTKTKPEPDNIFRFKEYIAFNTFGEVSIASPIRVVLAQPLISIKTIKKFRQSIW